MWRRGDFLISLFVFGFSRRAPPCSRAKRLIILANREPFDGVRSRTPWSSSRNISRTPWSSSRNFSRTPWTSSRNISRTPWTSSRKNLREEVQCLRGRELLLLLNCERFQSFRNARAMISLAFWKEPTNTGFCQLLVSWSSYHWWTNFDSWPLVF